MTTLTTTIARILFGLPFGIFGIFHFMQGSNMAGMVPVPGGVFWVYLTGLGLIGASVSIIIKKLTSLACLLLALMLAIFIVTIHIPTIVSATDQQTMMMGMQSLLKDTSLTGGALTYAGIFAKSVTGLELKDQV